MPTKVNVQLNTAQILESRGLGADKKAQQFFCNEVWRMSDPYTPMDNGNLKSNVSLASDGSSLTYNSPYARYQYYGNVMAGNPRQATGNHLTYAGAQMRGKEWTKRMWADRGQEIVKSVAAFIGGRSE